LDSYLLPKRFKQIKVDSNLYIKQQPHQGFQILVVYVNDCFLVNNSLDWISDLKTILLAKFDMTNEGSNHYCLGNQMLQN
jgi:hypothetical protein